jgi:hypothetical protein
MVVALPADATGLPDALSGKRASDRTLAYRCRGHVCSEPIYDIEALAVSAGSP